MIGIGIGKIGIGIGKIGTGIRKIANILISVRTCYRYLNQCKLNSEIDIGISIEINSENSVSSLFYGF